MKMHIDMCMHMCIGMRTSICIVMHGMHVMRVPICKGMRIKTSLHRRLELCLDVCAVLRTGMFVGMRMDM